MTRRLGFVGLALVVVWPPVELSSLHGWWYVAVSTVWIFGACCWLAVAVRHLLAQAQARIRRRWLAVWLDVSPEERALFEAQRRLRFLLDLPAPWDPSFPEPGREYADPVGWVVAALKAEEVRSNG